MRVDDDRGGIGKRGGGLPRTVPGSPIGMDRLSPDLTPENMLGRLQALLLVKGYPGFPLTKDRIVRDTLLLADAMGKGELKKAVGIKIIRYVPFDDEGRVAQVDRMLSYPIYVTFKDGPQGKFISTNRQGLAHVIPGDITNVDALLRRTAESREEDPLQAFNSYVIAIRFSVDSLLKKETLPKNKRDRLVAQKYLFLRKALKISEELGMTHELFHCYEEPTESFTLGMNELLLRDILRSLNNSDLPLQWEDQTKEHITDLDKKFLQEQYIEYEAGKRFPEIDENAAEIYRILFIHKKVAGEGSTVSDSNTVVVFSYPLVDTAVPVVTSEPTEQSATVGDPDLVAIGELDKLLEAGRIVEGPRSASSLNRDKYRMLLDWLRTHSLGEDSSSLWNKVQGSYPDDVDLVLHSPEGGEVVTPLDLQYLRDIATKATRKGRTNFASELLAMLDIV